MMFTSFHFSRIQAFATHLVISAVVAALTLLLMLALWYPPPLFSSMGGRTLLLLIIGCDVVIGPLVTLCIFNPAKSRKHLAFDLSIIALLQLSALMYGVYSMHAGRPVFLAFNENRFVVVAAAEVDQVSLARTQGEFSRLPESGPRWVGIRWPEDPRQRNDLKFYQFGRYGPQNLPEHLVPYETTKAAALKAAYRLEQMRGQTTQDRAQLQDALTRLGRTPNSLRMMALLAKETTLTVLLDATTGDIVDILDINPAKDPAASDAPA